MCGRYCLYEDGNEELREIMDRTEGEFKTGEVFPTDKAPILIQQSGAITPQAVCGAFLASGERASSFDARAETMPEKPLFRRSLTAMRCVIPSSGFFEWSHTGPKTKFQFNLPGSGILYMAGLYQDFGGERRFVIITTAANESMIEVHNRMPVVLGSAERDAWLGSWERTSEILQTVRPELVKEKKTLS